MKTTIFCFSATGNSLFVSRELAKLLGDVTLVPINAQTLKQMHGIPDLIGFVFPVYFCGIPKLVRDFVLSLDIKPTTYIFTVSTLGGSDYLSHQQIDQLLETKNSRLSYHAAIAMPGNYQLMYNTASGERQTKLFAKARNRIALIIDDIKSKRIKPLTHKKGLLAQFFDYYYRKAYNNFGGKDYNFRATEACVHCELCAKVCPVQNILMKDAKPSWQGKCQLCLACLHWCPTQAIQYLNKTVKRRRYHHPEITPEDIMP